MTEYVLPTEDAIAHNIMTGIISSALFVLDKKTPSDVGVDYKHLYYGIFNGLTTILRNATTYEQAMDAIKQLQCEAEDAYIEQGE
jgi:hypothetical protein